MDANGSNRDNHDDPRSGVICCSGGCLQPPGPRDHRVADPRSGVSGPDPAVEEGAPSPVAPDEELIMPPPGRLWPWAATLASAGLPFRLVDLDSGTGIAVPAERISAARRELAEYERVNRRWPWLTRGRPEVAAVSPAALLASLLVPLALVRFYLFTGPAALNTPAFTAGALRSTAVLRGEWWRLVTALTLHADPPHVLGNALLCGVLGAAVSQFTGVGVGWLLILLSGILGNLFSIPLHGPHVVAIGASTAVFGALGIVAMLQSVRIWPHGRGVGVWLSRSWIPIIASSAILAFLGTGGGTDLAGHAMGFVSGLGLGAAAAFPRRRRPPGWPIQGAAGSAAALLVILAWRQALAASGC